MKYTKEFKEEALKLSDEIGVRKTAEQLGLSVLHLGNRRGGQKALRDPRKTRGVSQADSRPARMRLLRAGGRL